MKYDEQYNILTNFYKKIIIELDEKNLYYKFYYNLDRKMSRNNIQSIIYNLLHNDNKDVLVNEYSLVQYVIDYLGINLVCLFVDDDFNLMMIVIIIYIYPKDLKIKLIDLYQWLSCYVIKVLFIM